MAQSLLLACGLNEDNSFIHISEESDVDGSFIISSLLSQRLRNQQESGVLLICLQHTLQHYVNAGLRLGYNLKMFKNLQAIDVMQEISDKFPVEIELADLYERISLKVKENFNEKSTITIVFDNLSILLNLGLEESAIEKLFYQLKDENFNVVTKLSNCDLNEVLNKNLQELCNINLNLIKLKSGNFKEVDGKICISKSNLNGLYEVEKYEKNILYKVNDRNIKIFNPGEIGVKV